MNYNEMIGETVFTDGGEYEIVAHIHDDGCRDYSINLYIGKAADGHHALIASDNAGMWLVGSEDDANLNRSHWELIAERVGEIDFDAIRAVDADLADWLEARKDEWEKAQGLIFAVVAWRKEIGEELFIDEHPTLRECYASAESQLEKWTECEKKKYNLFVAQSPAMTAEECERQSRDEDDIGSFNLDRCIVVKQYL
jgi:hypothetical protein